MLIWLREKRWQSLDVGGATYLGLLIPLINILMMPAAVAGAPLLWRRDGGDSPLSRMVEEMKKLPSIAREAGLLT